MVKSARHTDGAFFDLFFDYFFIFGKNEGVKKGVQKRGGGGGGWVQVLSTSVSNDSTKFFFPVIGSQLYLLKYCFKSIFVS